jgi:nitrogenase iron protein NifH
MIKLAFYGKGGIGKSTTVSNLAAVLAGKGLKVMQIGCDPKADSTIASSARTGNPDRSGSGPEKKNDFTLQDMVGRVCGNVVCVEAGGPTPGLGCAGRGIITALEKLKEKGAYEVYQSGCGPYTTYWAMSSAADFPCPCGTAMRTRSLF